MTLNKKQLCMRFREIAKCTHDDASFVIDTLSSIIMEELSRDNKVMFGKLGTFSVSHRVARNGFNPVTKEEMTIPARPSTRFRQTLMMRRLLIDRLGK